MAATTTPSKQRIVLAKDLARRWLEARSRPEYRIKVFYGAEHDGSGLGNLLRMYRDGKTRVGGIDPIRDLGIQEEFDHIILWSSDREKMVRLGKWFEDHKFDTTGVW